MTDRAMLEIMDVRAADTCCGYFDKDLVACRLGNWALRVSNRSESDQSWMMPRLDANLAKDLLART